MTRQTMKKGTEPVALTGAPKTFIEKA